MAAAQTLPSPAAEHDERPWSALRALQYYRLTLLTLLLLTVLLDSSYSLIKVQHSEQFLLVLLSCIALVLLTLPLGFLHWPGLTVQAGLLGVLDIAGLSLLAASAGGVNSDLLLLLPIALAGAGVLLPLAAVLALATLAGLALMLLWLGLDTLARDTLIGLLDQPLDLLPALLVDYASTLGRIAALTVAGGLAGLALWWLAERARASERQATEQAAAARALDLLNRAIVQQLQVGLVVIDRQNRLRLMNETAQIQLGCQGAVIEGLDPGQLAPALTRRLEQWRRSGKPPQPFRKAPHLPELSVRFTGLGLDAAHSSTLITLEDHSEVQQDLQRIKLAALGRMSAGIAHELRNPMNAIGHAAQLLQESATASATDRRMAAIIHNNVRRADRIIDDIMQMARRKPPQLEPLQLRSWLRAWREEYLSACEKPRPQINLVVDSHLIIRFDPGHLRQILDNLANNARFHGVAERENMARIRIAAGRDEHAPDRLILDFQDYGPGVPEPERHKLFEPFHTTKPQGTGLGLYLARELCEANQVRLRHLPVGRGACFRLEGLVIQNAVLPHVSNW